MGNPEIRSWVRDHGKPIDAKLWKVEEPASPEEAEPKPDEPPDPTRFLRRMRRMTQLYDLRPELGLKEAPIP
jgi:hypothetical protein